MPTSWRFDTGHDVPLQSTEGAPATSTFVSQAPEVPTLTYPIDVFAACRYFKRLDEVTKRLIQVNMQSKELELRFREASKQVRISVRK